MSVQTTADDSKESSLSDVKSAIKSLSAILIDECWGHDEYSSEYTEKLWKALEYLRKAKGEIQ